MNDRDYIIRAAELLEGFAEDLFNANQIDDLWAPDTEAEQENFNQWYETAAYLRQMAER